MSKQVITRSNMFPDIEGVGTTVEESRADFASKLPEGEFKHYFLGTRDPRMEEKLEIDERTLWFI